jgi:hypothetical protein
MTFKKCTKCQEIWATRDDILSSPDIRLIGYQANFDRPRDGLFLFNHISENCGNTIAVRVDKFVDMYDGPIYSESMTGLVECHSYCLEIYNLDKCRAKCRMEYIREIMLLILKIKSNKSPVTKRL